MFKLSGILHFIRDARKLHGSELDAHGHVDVWVLSQTLLRDGTYCLPVFPSVETELLLSAVAHNFTLEFFRNPLGRLSSSSRTYKKEELRERWP